MPYPTVSWTRISRSLFDARPAVAPEARRVTNRTATFAKLAAERAAVASRTRPLVVAGQYNRAAIMAAACAAAKAQQGATGEAWSVCMASALKGAWQTAKLIRARTAH